MAVSGCGAAGSPGAPALHGTSEAGSGQSDPSETQPPETQPPETEPAPGPRPDGLPGAAGDPRHGKVPGSDPLRISGAPPEAVPGLPAADGRALPVTTTPSTAAARDAAARAATTTGLAAAGAPAPAATIPVSIAGQAKAPEGGHPPSPEAGTVPRQHGYWDYPDCAPGPPWPSDCYPPSEWESPQNPSECGISGRTFHPDLGAGGICVGARPDERPRWTADVARWTSWCYDQPRGNCGWLLFEMKWALDYLGAHPWCVLNEYQDRVDAYGAGGLGNAVRDSHGWHNCATVVDPLVRHAPSGRTNDAGLLLSDTVPLAEQCRTVLPPDIELEARTRRFSEQPERFGNDCTAWAAWVESRPIARDWRECDRSARIAEEWMEHHHATPEPYFNVTC